MNWLMQLHGVMKMVRGLHRDITSEERGVLAQHLCADGVERAQVHALEARAEHLHARLEHLGGVLREGDDKD